MVGANTAFDAGHIKAHELSAYEVKIAQSNYRVIGAGLEFAGRRGAANDERPAKLNGKSDSLTIECLPKCSLHLRPGE